MIERAIKSRVLRVSRVRDFRDIFFLDVSVVAYSTRAEVAVTGRLSSWLFYTRTSRPLPASLPAAGCLRFCHHLVVVLLPNNTTQNKNNTNTRTHTYTYTRKSRTCAELPSSNNNTIFPIPLLRVSLTSRYLLSLSLILSASAS